MLNNMFKNIFTKKTGIDENTQQWIFDTFAWALENFNIQVFQKETQLVLPTNEFYSGRVESSEAMAKNIFDHTKNYAGMNNWPIELVNPTQNISSELPQLRVTRELRGKAANIEVVQDYGFNNQKSIHFTFNPNQLNQPQDLIASYAQQLATVLVLQQKVLPPGGQDYIPQAIDLLACVMGFGVIFANTAYQFKGGCGSCYNPRANRQATLSENDTVYALALFCLLKSISPKSVKQHLKSHLRKTYSLAYRELLSLKETSENPLFLNIKI